MPAQIVSDVSTVGVVLPTASGDARLYTCPFADTLASADEVPITSGNIAVQRSGSPTFLATHNGGVIASAARTQFALSFNTHGGGADAKVTELLVAGNSDTDAGNVKKQKYNVIYGDGSKDEGIAIINHATPSGEVEGVFAYAIDATPIFNIFSPATA